MQFHFTKTCFFRVCETFPTVVLHSSVVAQIQDERRHQMRIVLNRQASDCFISVQKVIGLHRCEIRMCHYNTQNRQDLFAPVRPLCACVRASSRRNPHRAFKGEPRASSAPPPRLSCRSRARLFLRRLHASRPQPPRSAAPRRVSCVSSIPQRSFLSAPGHHDHREGERRSVEGGAAAGAGRSSHTFCPARRESPARSRAA